MIDNVSVISGRSSYKFGLDFNFDRVLNFFPGLFSGSYTFPSYAAFASNTPSAYTQNFAGTGTTGASEASASRGDGPLDAGPDALKAGAPRGAPQRVLSP